MGTFQFYVITNRVVIGQGETAYFVGGVIIEVFGVFFFFFNFTSRAKNCLDREEEVDFPELSQCEPTSWMNTVRSW